MSIETTINSANVEMCEIDILAKMLLLLLKLKAV